MKFSKTFVRLARIYWCEWALAAVLGIFLACITGCAARVTSRGSGATGTGRPATAVENALAYSASLADTNKTLADSLISGQQSGVLPQTTVSNITSVQFTVADADKQITAVLNAVAKCEEAAGTGTPAYKNCTANGAQMNTLIQRIQANVNSLVSSGDLRIKDAKTQAAVEQAAKAIAQLAGQILSTLQQGGLLQ